MQRSERDGWLRLALRRLGAWLLDCFFVLWWVMIIGSVVVPLYLGGLTGRLGPIGANVLTAVLIVVPVTGLLAVQESGAKRSTFGKRLLRLGVQDAAGARLGLGRAIARNTVKFAVPWVFAHAAVVGLWLTSGPTVSPGLWPLLAVAYLLPLALVVSLFVGRGVAIHDRVSRSRVTSTPGA